MRAATGTFMEMRLPRPVEVKIKGHLGLQNSVHIVLGSDLSLSQPSFLYPYHSLWEWKCSLLATSYWKYLTGLVLQAL